MRRAAGWNRNRRFGSSNKPCAVDGPKARRKAGALLLNARSLDNLNAESLANCCGLKIATAEALLTAAKQRRAANG